ncbi:hypothetical protein BDW59DRAFT_158661 [Aspergillus cavernicola]|uniref:Zn(2)-C6 fungal-type domain-containing protein n=1 Tax=Aspergillus cavernicola TaxID=176166 RepID=A0ABR4IRC7_9EURO
MISLIGLANSSIEPDPLELTQFRRACDRCHAQKLRCQRIGSRNCDRCDKAGVTCVFSPSRRMRKTNQSQRDGNLRLSSASGTNSNQFCPNEDLTLDDLLQFDSDTTDWASHSADPIECDFENSLYGRFSPLLDPGVAAPGSSFPMLDTVTLAASKHPSTSASQDPEQLYLDYSSMSSKSVSDHSAPNTRAPPVAEPPHLSAHEQWIRNISDLNIKLYQHAAVFPQGGGVSSNRRASQCSTCSDGDDTTDQNRNIAIDQTFTITTQVLETLELVPSSLPVNGVRNGMEPLDQGTLLLIFSLYLRLLELYYAIFEQLQKMLFPPRYGSSTASLSSHYPRSLLSTDSPPCTDRLLDGRHPRFPVLSIGKFSLQASSSVHTLMTVQLAEQLLGRVNRMVQTVTRNKGSASNTPFRHDDHEYFTREEAGLDRLRDSSSSSSSSSGMGDVAELSLKAVEKRQMEVMAVVKAIKRALVSQ